MGWGAVLEDFGEDQSSLTKCKGGTIEIWMSINCQCGGGGEGEDHDNFTVPNGGIR